MKKPNNRRFVDFDLVIDTAGGVSVEYESEDAEALGCVLAPAGLPPSDPRKPPKPDKTAFMHMLAGALRVFAGVADRVGEAEVAAEGSQRRTTTRRQRKGPAPSEAEKLLAAEVYKRLTDRGGR